MNMNSNYWANRSNQRMYEYLQDSEKVSAEIEKAYRRSEQYIKSETDKIFQSFVQHTGISESEARLLMKTSIGKTAADKLKSALSSVSDESIRKKMLAEINAPAYQARIKRLEELNANIVSECNRLYGTELKLSTDLYTNVAEKAFSRTVYDIQKGTGLGYSFSQLPKSRIDEILRNNWSGKHYSQRIWGNTQKLAENLKSDLLSGMLSGKSGRKIAEDISKRYGVSIKNAERLVRTETTYIANQSELESYKESGIEKYRFTATLDSRTSAVCQQLDGQEFPVSEAQAGVNLPPMHAHCRSTTISVISEKCLENLERRAKNPDGTTSKVPADMSYKEWKEHNSGLPVIQNINQSKFTENLIEMNNGQKDVIKFRNIEKAMNKSDIGKELLQYVNENPVDIYLYYNVDVPEYLFGEQISGMDIINIYVSNTKTIENTAETIIHELTHRRYNIGGDLWAECVCRAQEYKHKYRRNVLTISELRAIIKEIKEAYNKDGTWKWRDRK